MERTVEHLNEFGNLRPRSSLPATSSAAARAVAEVIEVALHTLVATRLAVRIVIHETAVQAVAGIRRVALALAEIATAQDHPRSRVPQSDRFQV